MLDGCKIDSAFLLISFNDNSSLISTQLLRHYHYCDTTMTFRDYLVPSSVTNQEKLGAFMNGKTWQFKSQKNKDGSTGGNA